MYRVKWFHIAFVLVLALGLVTPAMAIDPGALGAVGAPPAFNSEQPGSVIVFPKFIRGTKNGELNSQFEISVTCPLGLRDPNTGFCPGFPEGTRVKLRAHWVCPSDQSFEHKYICQETDFDLFTTVYGTVSFNPENIGAAGFPTTPGSPTPGGAVRVPAPPCDKGYLIAWVIDTQDRPISYNALLGDAIIRDVNGAVSAYNAIPIQAIGAVNSAIALGPEGELPFTGAANAYALVSSSIQSSIRFEQALRGNLFAVSTNLTLLTLDVRSNRPNNPVFVDLDFYNANESLVSTVWEFICWTEIYLSDANGARDFVNTNLTEAAMGTRKGLVVSGPAEKFLFGNSNDTRGPVTLLGIVTTAVYDGTAYAYSYSLYHDLHLYTPTAFDAN
jgi:hypothetical protein